MLEKNQIAVNYEMKKENNSVDLDEALLGEKKLQDDISQSYDKYFLSSTFFLWYS